MRNEMTDDKTVYYRERSYKACVAEGWGLIFNHYKSVLKFAWAPVLMAAVGFAIVAFLLFVYYDWLTPAALAVTGALLLVYAVATACWHGAARVQVAFFRATGDLPTVSAYNFMHNIRRQLLKSLACVVASAAALVAVGVVVWAAVAVSGWWWAALLPLLALVLTGSQLAQFWATEDGTLARAWRMFAREGWRNLGSWILVQLTGWSVAGLTTFVFLLPAAVLAYSFFVSQVGEFNGDPAGMPAGAAWLFFLACVVGAFGMHLSSLLTLWPARLMAASLECKLQHKEAQGRELQQLRQEQEALNR